MPVNNSYPQYTCANYPHCKITIEDRGNVQWDTDKNKEYSAVNPTIPRAGCFYCFDCSDAANTDHLSQVDTLVNS